MEIDKELLQAGIEVISEYTTTLPESAKQQIAQRMLQKNRLGDEDWCKQVIASQELNIAKLKQKAKIQGYFPFIFVGIGAYRWICKNYGKWTLKVMREKLKNPLDIHRLFAIQFAATMNLLGEEECKKQSDLYKFVIDSDFWEKTKEDRNKWKTYKKERKALAKQRPESGEAIH